MTASRILGLVAFSALAVGCGSERREAPIDTARPVDSSASAAPPVAQSSPVDSTSPTDSSISQGKADSTVAMAPAEAKYYPDCPFECCKLGDWSTDDSIPVYAEMRSTGAPSFYVLPHEHFTARDSAKLFTNSPGIIRFRAPMRLFKFLNDEAPPHLRDHDSAWIARLKAPVVPGESLLWVGHCPECGEFAVFASESLIVWQFWTEPGAYEDSTAPAILERPLNREWWVRIVRNGQFGWIQAFAAHHLSGDDACA